MFPSFKPAHRKCQTRGLLLEGAHYWHKDLYRVLMEMYDFDKRIAKHLVNYYGDRAFRVADIALEKGL